MRKIYEDLLSYLWQTRKFSHPAFTTDGHSVEIIHPGSLNNDSGPDFFGARLKIGNTIWAGNVEIHVKSSDWLKHGHHNNPAYDSVIMHVVYEHDADIVRQSQIIPVLEMKKFISQNLIDSYYALLASPSWIPCNNNLKDIGTISIRPWLSSLCEERLTRKTIQIRDLFASNAMNWEESFYQWLASCMGFNLNNNAFLMLARSIPFKTLMKHRNNKLQLESLLFGQSGLLLQTANDEYATRLKKEYLFLSGKYSLTPLQPTVWKFMRTRPGNFPTIRIAQFADVLSRTNSILGEILGKACLKDIRTMLTAEVSPYWHRHYHFGKPFEKPHSNVLGKQGIDNLIINAVVPFIYLYGKFHDNQVHWQKALQILKQLEPENNIIIRNWKGLNIGADNASESQALIELYKMYCLPKRCLACSIGATLLPDIC
jgi:hypothetical protein